MRGDDPFAAMKNLKRFSDRAAAGDFFLQAADIRDPNDHILSQEDFDEITDFTDLPTSLFACNVHQSVFEDEQRRVCVTISVTWMRMDLKLSIRLVRPGSVYIITSQAKHLV